MRGAIETLLSVAQPPPVIPVKVWWDERRQKWRKLPLVDWPLATTDRHVLEGWARQYPDAKPGIPLALTDLVAIDLEDCADAAFHEAWRKPEKVVTFKGRPILVPEHYSIYPTPSGGRHIVFRQPDPPVAGRFRWSDGVEILAKCVLTLHDPSAILYPRVAQRAVLPEAFRQRWVAEAGRGDLGQPVSPINKGKVHVVHACGDGHRATEALFLLDPREFGRGHHDEWLSIMNSAKYEGVGEDDFVRWSLQDPDFAGDEAIIRRKWHSLTPRHAGALWAALSERGIRVRHTPARDIEDQHSWRYWGHCTIARCGGPNQTQAPFHMR
jgi:hypothetical protein